MKIFLNVMNEYDEQAGLDNNKIELLESKKTATSLNPYRIKDRSKEIVLTHIDWGIFFFFFSETNAFDWQFTM